MTEAALKPSPQEKKLDVRAQLHFSSWVLLE
jgi:hypothetical protein